MKKLMIAAAIVCAAALSQAAQVDWKVSNSAVKDYGGAALKSANAYLVLATPGEAFDTFKANLADGTINAGNIADKTVNSLYLGTGVTGSTDKKAGNIDQLPSNTSSLLVAGKPYDLVYVTFDTVGGKDYYYLSSTQQGSAWGGSEYTEELADPAAWNSYSASNWHEVSAVPEPTSGLLLLLGVAGLALKRKRA